MPPYQQEDRLRPLISRLVEPGLVPAIQKFHDDHLDDILANPGSGHNHQNWYGGYCDHIVQCLTLAEQQYKMLCKFHSAKFGNERKFASYTPPFTLASAALVLYFHDVEKIPKYTRTPHMFNDALKYNQEIWYYGVLPEWYGIIFMPNEQNALKYVHGEHDHSKTERKAKPLAAFCHCCDMMSSRMFHDTYELRVPNGSDVLPQV
jgi:hypothetical protein